MSEQERMDMLEKLIAEGMSPEDAEAQVAEAEEGDTAASVVPEGEETAPTPEEDEDETSTAVTDVDENVSEDNPNETPDGVGNPDTLGQDDHDSEEQQTFDRKYVEKLRKESAGYREKAKRSEELEQQLHAALVRLDGRLADPADLPFDEEHLADGDALAAAITDLVNRKPGLKAQQLSGDVGAGKRGSKPKPSADLISLIRSM